MSDLMVTVTEASIFKLEDEIERLTTVKDAAQLVMSGWPAYWVGDANALIEALAAVDKGDTP